MSSKGHGSLPCSLPWKWGDSKTNLLILFATNSDSSMTGKIMPDDWPILCYIQSSHTVFWMSVSRIIFPVSQLLNSLIKFSSPSLCRAPQNYFTIRHLSTLSLQPHVLSRQYQSRSVSSHTSLLDDEKRRLACSEHDYCSISENALNHYEENSVQHQSSESQNDDEFYRMVQIELKDSIDSIQGTESSNDVYVLVFTCNRCQHRSAKKFSKVNLVGRNFGTWLQILATTSLKYIPFGR